MKLLVLPFSGGNQYSLSYIKKHLPAGMEFIPLELPGRGLRIAEPLITGVPAMVNDLYEQVKHLVKEPYAILGHCMGGLLAWLLAEKAIEASSAYPEHLFVYNCAAPSSFNTSRQLQLSTEEVKQLLLDFGTDAALVEDEDFFDMLEPVVRTDMEAFHHYVHRNRMPLPIPVTVVIDKAYSLLSAEINQWQAETTIPVRFHQLPGSLINCLPQLEKVLSAVHAI